MSKPRRTSRSKAVEPSEAYFTMCAICRAFALEVLDMQSCYVNELDRLEPNQPTHELATSFVDEINCSHLCSKYLFHRMCVCVHVAQACFLTSELD